jgi:arginine decarboxylase
LNIVGGLPIRNSLDFIYDYEYMAEEIIAQIKSICERNEVPEPDVFTEFGQFTVGESGAVLFSIIDQKRQNDREVWNMIDSSFMNTLPDTWAINQKFILLAVNNWDSEYERIFLGGLTCDRKIITMLKAIPMPFICRNSMKRNRNILDFSTRVLTRKQ